VPVEVLRRRGKYAGFKSLPIASEEEQWANEKYRRNVKGGDNLLHRLLEIAILNAVAVVVPEKKKCKRGVADAVIQTFH